MNETESKIVNDTIDAKLYSTRVISGATFLGGPLAAGYLIGENFKALDKPKEARNSLIIGIFSTIILFSGIFMIPENIIDKVPNQIIPLLYTSITYGIVEWLQGDILKTHKENGNLFFSGWNAAAVGFVSLLILGAGLFGYAYLSTDNELYEKYDAELAQFSKNENETLFFYDQLNTGTNYSLIQDLEKKIIPKWKENIEIINRTNEFENLPSELIEQNKVLLKYSELRLRAFELFRKAIREDTDKYAIELEQVHLQIEKEVNKLN